MSDTESLKKSNSFIKKESFYNNLNSSSSKTQDLLEREQLTDIRILKVWVAAAAADIILDQMHHQYITLLTAFTRVEWKSSSVLAGDKSWSTQTNL